MVEHLPWIGQQYGNGLFGCQRIAIVGHSHYEGDVDVDDDDDFTIDVVNGVMAGTRLPFFTRIATWFGTTPGVLLDQTVFLNFLPERIGTSIDKSKRGTPEQYERARTRLLNVMRQCDVHKVIVFSLGLETDLPSPLQLADGQTYRRLSTPPKHYYWHSYAMNGRIVPMFVVPHPRSSVSNAEMVEVVSEISGFSLPLPA